jgi:phage FluMu protein Com
MNKNAKEYPIIARCKSCGASLGASSSNEMSGTLVKCGRCGTMNSRKLRAVAEEARIKGEKLYTRRI